MTRAAAAGIPPGATRASGAAHGGDTDSAEASEAHGELIRSKDFLRRIYLEHYRFFRDEVRGLPRGSVVELGSGGGFLSEVLPGVVATDVLPLSTTRVVVSAVSLPFRNRSVSALLLLNVLHHLQDPESFFREASDCLVPGGKIVMVEPANTLFSRFVYTRFHHEPFDPMMPGWSLAPGGRLSAANDALASIIFERDRALFLQRFPSLFIERHEPTMPFTYILSGGLSRRALLPGRAYPAVRAVERLLRPLNPWLGLFVKIVVRRRPA